MADLRKDTFEIMAEAAGRVKVADMVEACENAETAEVPAVSENTDASKAVASSKSASDIVRKYIKRPVVVEAYQTDKEITIHTLEGDMKAMPGDYIITGVEGEQYPCKPDIFEKTYEETLDETLDEI